jgi:hypothetical protein
MRRRLLPRQPNVLVFRLRPLLRRQRRRLVSKRSELRLKLLRPALQPRTV